MTRRPCRWQRALAVATVCAAGASPAAGSGRSTIAVTARVAGTAAIEQRELPAGVTVTPQDIERGFVSTRATLTVSSNDAEGFLLTVWPRADWFESVGIVGERARATVGADGGALIWRVPNAGTTSLTLDLTFRLRPGVDAATLPWPVEFQVAAL